MHVFRLMDERRVVITIVVNADGIFAVREKSRCDLFGRGFNGMVSSKTLKSYVGILGDRMSEIRRREC